MNRLQMRILRLMPKSAAHSLYYRSKMKRKLRLNPPVTFNEKIQWLMINRYGKNEAKYADKLLVRNYVTDCGYGDKLTKLLGVYKSTSEINLDSLPNEFVLKTTHAAGKRYYSICADKSKYDAESELNRLENALKVDYSNVAFEPHYHYIEPRIIAEEFLKSKDGLPDYKLFCFSGKCECILVCSDRQNELKRDYYDLNWEYLPYVKDEFRSNTKHMRPSVLDEMIEMAEVLSRPFAFARIDLYDADGRVVFGEITLTPAAGVNRTYTLEGDEALGRFLNIGRG